MLKEKGQLVYSTGFRNAFPLTTYSGKAKQRLRNYEIDDPQLGKVTIASKEHRESSLITRGIRSPSKPISFVNTTKKSSYYSVFLGETLVRDKEAAKEIIQGISGIPLPKNCKIITDKTLFDEIKKSSNE